MTVRMNKNMPNMQTNNHYSVLHKMSDFLVALRYHKQA